MLQKILLSLVIAAFLGVILITQFKVRPHVQGIIDVREQQRSRAVRAEDSLKKTRTTLANTEQKLSNTEKTLAQTKTDLAAANTRADNEQNRANGLKTDLDKTQADLRSTRQDLSAWTNLGIPVEQVAAIIKAEKELRAEKAVLEHIMERIRIRSNRVMLTEPPDVVSSDVQTSPEDAQCLLATRSCRP